MSSVLQGRARSIALDNEPAVKAFSGYLYGQFPPHRHNLQTCVNVLKNTLDACVQAYYQIKQLPFGKQLQVGIVHNPLRFIPRHDFFVERWLCSFLTTITHTLVHQFLSTGDFDYHKCCLADVHHHDQRAPGALDWIGVNFYARAVIGFNWQNGFGPTCFPGQEMGDMYLCSDPKGFEDAIREAAKLGKPVHITETGMADKSDAKRKQLIIAYASVVNKLRAEGIKIPTVVLWTYEENYEWNERHQDFGFCKDGQPRPSFFAANNILQQEVSVPLEEEDFNDPDADVDDKLCKAAN